MQQRARLGSWSTNVAPRDGAHDTFEVSRVGRDDDRVFRESLRSDENVAIEARTGRSDDARLAENRPKLRSSTPGRRRHRKVAQFSVSSSKRAMVRCASIRSHSRRSS